MSIEPVPKPQNADVSTAASEGLGTRLCAESSESHNTRDGLAGEGGVQAEGDHQEDGEDTRKERSSGHCSITNHGEDPTSLRFYSVDSIEKYAFEVYTAKNIAYAFIASSDFEEGAESNMLESWS